ncbi:AraC-like ligand-binding domain-containing protein [Sinorhizobium meliloti]
MKGKSGTLCQPDRSALLFDTDTRKLPLKKALEFWEESAGSLYDFYIATPESFYTHGRTLCCGKILLNYCVSVEQKLSRSSYRIGMDGFDHYEVQFFLDGMWRRGDGKLEAQAGSGDLIVHDTAQAHAGSASDFTNVTLFVPRFLLAPLLDRPDEQNMRVIGSDNPLVGLLRSHVIGLFRTLPSLDAAQAALMVSPTVELIAATLNGTERQDNSRGVAAAQFNSIRGYIDEHVLDQGLSVEQLAVKFFAPQTDLSFLTGRWGRVIYPETAASFGSSVPPGSAACPQVHRRYRPGAWLSLRAQLYTRLSANVWDDPARNPRHGPQDLARGGARIAKLVLSGIAMGAVMPWSGLRAEII